MDINYIVENYKVFKIRKGPKVRQIEAPSDELKIRQQGYINFFNSFNAFYPGCTARPGKSVLDNAAPHHGAKIILKTDLKSFYPSVNLKHILRNLDLDSRDEWKKKAREIVHECLFPNRGQLVLPTGAPTSPVLCNIAATDLDLALASLAMNYGYVYTRYIDDLTFSTKGKRENKLKYNVIKTIYQYDLVPNKEKTEWVYPNKNQKFAVTGIAIDDGRHNSKVLKEIRRICRARLDKVALNNIQLDKVTQGYLSYVRMIDKLSFEKLNKYLEQRRIFYTSIGIYSNDTLGNEFNSPQF